MISFFISAWLGLSLVVPAHANAPTVPKSELTSTTTIAAYVRQVQAVNGLGDDFYDTLEYESAGWQNGQSTVKNPRGPNGREDSWGVCQIHLPDHPAITWEEAMDPTWCVPWSAHEFKKGRQWQWSGWYVQRRRQQPHFADE